eukprot:scaffold85_cov358-Pavlova_lutheri.AAC.27
MPRPGAAWAPPGAPPATQVRWDAATRALGAGSIAVRSPSTRFASPRADAWCRDARGCGRNGRRWRWTQCSPPPPNPNGKKGMECRCGKEVHPRVLGSVVLLLPTPG